MKEILKHGWNFVSQLGLAMRQWQSEDWAHQGPSPPWQLPEAVGIPKDNGHAYSGLLEHEEPLNS